MEILWASLQVTPFWWMIPYILMQWNCPFCILRSGQSQFLKNDVFLSLKFLSLKIVFNIANNENLVKCCLWGISSGSLLFDNVSTRIKRAKLYANNIGTGQLVCIYAVGSALLLFCLDSIVVKLATCNISVSKTISLGKLDELCTTWSQFPSTGFLATRQVESQSKKSWVSG